MTASPFIGKSGDPVCNFPISFDKPGEYISRLTNVICATPDGKTIYAPESSARINISKAGVSKIELIENEVPDMRDFTIIVEGKLARCIGLNDETGIYVYDVNGRTVMTTCDKCFELPSIGVYIVSPIGYVSKKILIK